MTTGSTLPQARQEGAASLPPWHHARILIVDDDPADVALLERILRKAGYDNIVGMTDPRAASARQAELRPDLVVLDIKMPGVDGFEVLQALDDIRRDSFLPVLVMTGLPDRATRLRALEAGAQDFITKPYDDCEVANRVRNLVQLRWMYEAQRAARLDVERQVAERTARLHDALELLKQAEKELSRRLEQSETSSRQKSVFVVEMAHELRTPLNAILGFAELMRDECSGPLGNPKYKDYAAVIHRSGDFLLHLVNDLLDLSQAEAGKLDVRLEQVDASAVVTATAEMLAGLAKEAGVAVRIDIPRDFPPLRTDERRLRQVLVNIVTNAVKFTPAGGSVTLQGRYDPQEGAALIVVSDSGVGIAPEDIPAPAGAAEAGPTAGFARSANRPRATVICRRWLLPQDCVQMSSRRCRSSRRRARRVRIWSASGVFGRTWTPASPAGSAKQRSAPTSRSSEL